jgi:hypothetical protein
MVAVLEEAGELRIPSDVRQRLVRISPATIDRLLRTHRYRRRRCATKPGSLLKEKIPVRTFADWDEAHPGFLEVDLMAHCGESVARHAAGEFLHTLNAVDLATGWCEPLALPNRSQGAVAEAIGIMRKRLPFPLLGIDSDNDSAFINANLPRYCTEAGITFTHSRPYKKNDQVEARLPM